MKIRQWISGKELMERWKINPLDLVEIVLYERLTIYEADGKLTKLDHESAIWANHTGPWPPYPKVENPTIYDYILNSSAYDFEMPSISIPYDYIPLASRIEHCMFKLSEVEYFEKEHNLILPVVQPEQNDKKRLFDAHKELVRKKSSELWRINPGITIKDMALRDEISAIVKKEADTSSLEKEVKQKKERKKTKLQICREKVREKAAALWSRNESIPIADMVVRNEITQVLENVCGDMFTEKTLRDWIKDLCPNRKPGRRPNPKKKSMKPTKKTEG
uniref:Uncharacterized protein n=1 Tax=Desulfobacca acetoxidans TaxID=60893 RepID=A0A7C3SJ93_9BACT